MSKNILDDTEESVSSSVNTAKTPKLDKELKTHEKKKFKKWVLSKTKKHILNNLITKKSPLQLFLYWGGISLLLMLSIALLFVGIIVLVARFKNSIPTYFIPWIYAGAYIVSTLLVAMPFFFWYKNGIYMQKQQKDTVNKNDTTE